MIKIASPLADKKITKMINGIIQETEKPITGVKASQKRILNEEKGILVLTGDTTPMDLITHLPALCEEKKIKYIFVESRHQLKGEYTCVFIKKDQNNEKIMELYEKL
ncbi:putative H/ACA ribonucleoprotein complex subunit 2-like protein [Nosema granulosis]|uniref:H/ACA ribonucleoprotein complex subunit 2-like protein n=1 Tax=Nosema granulosis TaxID=83296 RepID=A0A9P6GVA6_9MICR|nr:putative H/ACA ribonucleoprotein complex subunit 2-like protein [Nosema granulosis]